jgi:N-carbamoylputrescine amidase
MEMRSSSKENLDKSVRLMEQAKAFSADMIVFPTGLITGVTPQNERGRKFSHLPGLEAGDIPVIQDKCRETNLFAVLKAYLEEAGNYYDIDVMIDHTGTVLSVSKTVHITQAKYSPGTAARVTSEGHHQVYDTPFGRIGIVICPSGGLSAQIRACAQSGAKLVMISTTDLAEESMAYFKWEMRMQSCLNKVFIAVCNQAGTAGTVTFYGQSFLASPNGDLLYRAGEQEELAVWNVPLG